MTADDERAIGDARLSVRLSAIFQDAERQAQSALQARWNAYRRTEDWERVAEQQRKEITALEQEIAGLVNDLSYAMAAMQTYRDRAASLDTIQVGTEHLLAALRELERRRDAATPVGRAADTIAFLHRELADAHGANRAYAGLLAAIRTALGGEDDADLVERACSLTAEMKRLIMQDILKRERVEQAEQKAACTQQRLDRLMEVIGAHQDAVDGIQAAEERMRTVYAELKGGQGDEKDAETIRATQ